MATVQVVDNGHLMSGCQQLPDGVRANISRTTGNQDF
jgi:hypothetical protein